ncbi:DEAD/DEAH box helicase [Limosilactobacillus reuteri]|uniref:DEAD/DEAH box helicase n=1 Tax=Limosilactobacillus reuteri TaxID=1598 RepID=UPI000B97E657|nr:DEAD/DEAH box helicase [Limosilactobacillus reuteri]OYS78982.1 DEAD/DEAH box helicase [Limosilactobacillus reuteri]OYS82688.1 DEAD/DEAH box helicase [Limosilactobacillus reuteri]OYS84334.1 DEAD/DEAH box helicase [Limosilactobacillus reuteri]
MFKLRDYQQETIDNIYQSMRYGNHRIVVQQPPRTGKTVIMAEIARRATRRGNRIMFLIHRKEVLAQAIATFKAQGVDMDLATMGMVQTLTRRIDNLSTPQVILVDESHHSLAKSYLRILKTFPEAYVLYFTATPVRTGHKQMDLISDDLIPGKSIKWLTEHGFLAPFKYYGLGDIDRSKLRKANGDYTNSSMDEALSHQIYGHIVQQYQRLAKGKQAVVYCHSIESAKEVAAKFKQANISAVELDGETPAKKRDEIVEKFRKQKITILVNVNLFTEGIDLPNVDCVIMARPTSSLALYLQFSMRCLNPRKGKTAIIIDHVDNFLTFGLPNSDRDWNKAIQTRDKRKKKPNTGGPAICQCKYCFGIFYRADMQNNSCPLCGHKLESERKDYKVVNVDLQEIKANEAIKHRKAMVNKILSDQVVANVADKSPGQLNTVAELKAYAELHHYKKGWWYYVAKKKGLIR